MKEERDYKEVKRKGILSFSRALIALLIALVSVSAATFAWYIYNTEAHTTKVRMAAGSSVSLSISNSYDGEYSTSVLMDSFAGRLVPVSTNKITKGFQKVADFRYGDVGEPHRIANLFKNSEPTDYYKTSLFIKSNGDKNLRLYISNIGFEDSNASLPISSAIRVGFVVHAQGLGQPEISEYIFAISSAKNPGKEYNTETGTEGYVLDAYKTDGSTVSFSPYTSANYCYYDSSLGLSYTSSSSIVLADFVGDGEPVQVDVYIWLEGCDEDCTMTLGSTTLKNLALYFSGIYEE